MHEPKTIIMENKLNKHQFIEFAERQLEEHVAELNTQYEGRTMANEDEKKTAYEKHFKMFTAELEQKSKELGEEEDSTNTIREYQEKFKRSLSQ